MAAKKQAKRTARKSAERPDPFTGLPFVGRRKTVKSWQRPLSYWNVRPSGDYTADCKTGSQYALLYLAAEAADEGGAKRLQMIVEDMPRRLTGLEIGFLTLVSYAAASGRQRAKEVFAYWERCEAREAAKDKRSVPLVAVAGRGTSRDQVRAVTTLASVFKTRLAGRLTHEADTGYTGTVREKIAAARAAQKALSATAPDSDGMQAALVANQAALEAAAQAEPLTLREAAQQLAFVVSETAANFDCPATEAIEHAGFDLAGFAAKLLKLTDYAPPKKRLPTLTKGKRVTKAGLLYRYHAFLGMELNLVGLELYGDRNVARQFMPIDGKVDGVLFKNGNSNFGAKLPRRAKAALSAIGIDTVAADL